MLIGSPEAGDVNEKCSHKRAAGKMDRMMLWRKWILLGALIAALAWPAAWPARAQSTARLSVYPAEIQVPAGNDLPLELVVTGGVNVNAFDVTVTYDPDVLTLSDWAHGDYLSNLAVVSQVNQPGSLRVAATQLATAPASGDGVLLRLNFRAAAAGVSPVTIARAEFAGPTGAKTEPQRDHGTVTVVSAATFTPTPTVTRTPTATFTRTATVATPVPTATAVTPAATPTGTATAPAVTQTTATPLAGATATQPTLMGTVTDPAQPAPPPGAQTAYPGGQVPPSAPGAMPDGAQAETRAETVMPQAEIQPGEAAEGGESGGWLANLLWGALIAAGLAVAAMLMIIIWRKLRRERKDEDLL